MNDNGKVILKVLLFCLAFTALAGVISVMSSSNSLGQVVGSGFWATFCALLMLAFASRTDKKTTQGAVLLGMVLIVIEFIMVMALIWQVPRMMGLNRVEESLRITCLIIVPWGTAAMIFLTHFATPFTRITGQTGLIAIVISFILALIAAWTGNYYWQDERWWITAWTVGHAGILSAICLAGVGTPVVAWTGKTPDPEHGSLRHWRWIGILCVWIIALVLLYHTWKEFHVGLEGVPAIVLPIIGALGVLVPFLHLVLFAPLLPNQRWVGQLTAALGIGTMTLLTALAIMQDENDMLGRLIAAGAIATACASLALLVLARLNVKTTFGESQSVDVRIHLTCPRCRQLQDMAAGASQCKHCGLKIELKFEDPCCTQCGYMLYMLETDNCPECGHVINTTTADVSADLSEPQGVSLRSYESKST